MRNFLTNAASKKCMTGEGGREMKCSEFESMIDALIDGEIDKSARDAMRKHADSCESCSEKLRAAEMLQDILSHMDDSVAVPLQAPRGCGARSGGGGAKEEICKNLPRCGRGGCGTRACDLPADAVEIADGRNEKAGCARRSRRRKRNGRGSATKRRGKRRVRLRKRIWRTRCS